MGNSNTTDATTQNSGGWCIDRSAIIQFVRTQQATLRRTISITPEEHSFVLFAVFFSWGTLRVAHSSAFPCRVWHIAVHFCAPTLWSPNSGLHIYLIISRISRNQHSEFSSLKIEDFSIFSTDGTTIMIDLNDRFVDASVFCLVAV